MSNLLFDMAVCISQNEINSQFARLFDAGYIKPQIVANGLSKSGGIFGGGGSLALSSYLRGPITAPQVQLAQTSNPLEAVFEFTFQNKQVVPADLGVSQTDFDTAFQRNASGTTDGLLLKLEDIPAAGTTLSSQKVNYWLRSSVSKVGSISKTTYSLIPAMYFSLDGNPTMISLDGLQLSFKIMLGQIPATVDDIKQQVAQNSVPQELLDTITNNGFNSSSFSLNQLFLDFDTVNFSESTLSDADGALGNQLTGISLQSDGTFQVATISLSDMLQSEPDFSTAFTTNLLYAFGEDNKNVSGRGDYLVGVVAASGNPGTTNPNDPPSLVPTYIGFSTTPNTDTQLSSLNFQVMCGDGGEGRVPKNDDGTVKNITTPYVSSEDFSGELLLSGDVFFNPFILAKLQQELNTGSPWTNNAEGSWTSSYAGSSTQYNERPVDAIGAGHHYWVVQDDTNVYNIQLAGNTIQVSGTIQRTITINYRLVAGGNDNDPVYSWWQSGTLNWSNDVTIGIDTNQELTFSGNPNFPAAAIGAVNKNDAAKVMDFIASLLKFLPTPGDFIPMADSLSHTAEGLSMALVGGLKNNFISPTGKVFFLNNPRFNSDSSLQMDITYEV